MRELLRSTFTWRLIGGFALGAAGLFAAHAATLSDAPPTPVAHVLR